MKIRVILGDQLYAQTLAGPARGTHAYMAEDFELCTRFKYHKHKLVLFLASMRSHRDALVAAGVDVTYVPLSESPTRLARNSPPLSYEEGLIAHCKAARATEVEWTEIEDTFMAKRLETACKEAGLRITVLPSPGFLTSREAFADYLAGGRKPFMKTFYETQRRRLGVLMRTDGKPVGERFSFDEDNRLKLPADVVPPALPTVKHGPNVRAVSALVDALFPSHPGSTASFWLPTTRAGARAWFESFLASRLADFGPYEDALGPHPFVFHSVVSPLLNMGLLTPSEIVDDAVAFARDNGTPLNSLEGFVRQVIGWREFVRGIYQNYGEREEAANFFGHDRLLSDAWYKGNTGVPPLDDVLEKVLARGYAHHIERLMVLGNIMLLCGVHPKEAHRWFMEMFVDSGDWVMGPNVYGMSQFSDGGLFATKPYVCGSNYLLKMGPWKKGAWCDGLDGLYWGFVERNKAFYLSNPRMGMVVGTLMKMDPVRRANLAKAADALTEQLTRPAAP